VQEGPGPIAADSLAAESYRNHGKFADNPDAAPLSVKGNASTFANQDTSSAKVLPPTPDAEARESQEAWNESSKLKGASGLKYPEGSGGPPKFSGAHDEYGYWGGAGTKSGGSGEYASGLAKSGSGHTGGEEYRVNAKADPAPTYVGSVTGDVLDKGMMKPKGRNVTEGGFDSDTTENANFSAKIGTDKDPGRVAEQRLESENAETAEDAGSGPRQKGIVKGVVGFENLKTDEEA
jgi:hypothetical protein